MSYQRLLCRLMLKKRSLALWYTVLWDTVSTEFQKKSNGIYRLVAECKFTAAFYWPKTNGLPDISPATWVYSRSADNCNLGSATMVSHVQVHSKNGEENSIIKGKRKSGGARVNKEPMAFHWLNCDGLSLAELLPGKKRKLFFFRWLCYLHRAWELPWENGISADPEGR